MTTDDRPFDWREPAAVAAGCAIGAGARWCIGSALDVDAASTGAFPWHTLLANLLGCLAIGVGAARSADPIRRAFVVTGVLGGFTTMSAFGVEVYDLSEAGRGDLAAAYVIASVIGGVTATWASSTWADRPSPTGAGDLR